MAYLCSGDLAVGDFLLLAETYPWPADVLLMAFTPSEARFEKFILDRDFLCATEQGRIFFSTGELSWRYMNSVFRVVYLGGGPAPENLGDHSDELTGLTPSIESVLLWGVRTNTRDEWLEQQVPRRFSYPIDSGAIPRGRVALKTEIWTDSAGIPVFGRYHGIEEINSGE